MGVKKNSKLFTIKRFNNNMIKCYACNKIFSFRNSFCFLFVMQNNQTFYGVQVMFVVTCYLSVELIKT